MSAETLNCPMCGAAATSATTHCPYCESRLATVSCPSCFGMMFSESRHCPHCGARRAARAEAGEPVSARRCPRCRVEMEQVTVGATMLRECPQCDGLWLDQNGFEQMCADREQQSAVLGSARPAPAEPSNDRDAREPNVRYVPCPQCGQLMNRLNFARCSGVIVDMCKGHGLWFDRDELRQLVEFIRAGGLEASRVREKAQLAEEQSCFQQEQLAAATRAAFMPEAEERARVTGVLAVAGNILSSLFE